MNNDLIVLTPKLYQKMARLTKAVGLPLAVSSYEEMGCWGSLCFAPSAIFKDVRQFDSKLYERALVTIAADFDFPEFRAAGAVRPEMDWSVLHADEVIPFIIQHEIGHHLDNFDMMATWTMPDPTIRNECSRLIGYVNEILADRYAWNQLRPGEPLPVNANGVRDAAKFAEAHAYLEAHCEKRSKYKVRPLSPHQYKDVPSEMLETRERAAYVGPQVDEQLLTQEIEKVALRSRKISDSPISFGVELAGYSPIDVRPSFSRQEQTYWYGGGNFGISLNPETPTLVSIGTPEGTFPCSVEQILRYIDRLEPKEQARVMFMAGRHFGIEGDVSLPVGPMPPFAYTGGDLGLGDGDVEPWIDFIDGYGRKWVTHSVEQVLRNVQYFSIGRGPNSLLSDAAYHYGLEPRALVEGPEIARAA